MKTIFYSEHAIKQLEQFWLKQEIVSPPNNRISLYGVRFSKFENDYEIGTIPTANKFKRITRSLAEFIQLYINNDAIIYEY